MILLLEEPHIREVSVMYIIILQHSHIKEER